MSHQCQCCPLAPSMPHNTQELGPFHGLLHPTPVTEPRAHHLRSAGSRDSLEAHLSVTVKHERGPMTKPPVLECVASTRGPCFKHLKMLVTSEKDLKAVPVSPPLCLRLCCCLCRRGRLLPNATCRDSLSLGAVSKGHLLHEALFLVLKKH